MKFNKPPLTIEWQVCLLKDRGMAAIEDEPLPPTTSNTSIIEPVD